MAIYNPDSFFHSPKLYESGLDCFGDFIPIGMPNCRCSHSTFKVLNESVFRFLRDSSKSAIFMPFYLVIVDEIQMEEQLLWCNSSRNDAERKNFLVCHPAKMAIFKTLWHIFFPFMCSPSLFRGETLPAAYFLASSRLSLFKISRYNFTFILWVMQKYLKMRWDGSLLGVIFL